MEKAMGRVGTTGGLVVAALLGVLADGAGSAVAAESPRFPREPLDIRFPVNPVRPDDVAVIIGNADYRTLGRDIPDVIPAHADAESFFRYAVATLGVRERNVIDLRDATGTELVRVFGTAADPRGQLSDWVKPGTDVTVYYSGHGAPGPDGGTYLVPVDAEAARVHLGGYPLATLFANLDKLPARRVTLILEACFSGQAQGGTLVPGASGIAVTPRTPAPLAKVTVISAGAADQIASWDESRRSGLFTKHYLTGMAGGADRRPHGDGDGRVSPDEIKAYLDATLTYEARRFWGRTQIAEIRAAGREAR